MARPPSVLVLVLDSLRADHLGCYGGSLPLTPNLDRLATQGHLFEQCFCPGIPTHPSFATFYTGQHPLTHNVVTHGGQVGLDGQAAVLPELLLEAGYTTGAIDNLGWGRWSWLNRGYEYYVDPSRRQKMPLMVHAEALNAPALEFLRGQGRQPFFLLVHYWDVHTPYFPPKPYRERFYRGADPRDPANQSLAPLWRHPLGRVWQDTWFKWLGGVTDSAYVDALYAGALCYLDEQIGALLEELDRLGLAEDTLVLAFADHGESLTEHGIYYDHHGLYDCCLRVPLIARWPAGLAAGVRRPELVQHYDLAPTVLAAAGLPLLAAAEGRSLLPAAEAIAREAVVSAECTWQAKWSLRRGGHKLIVAREADYYGTPPRELYDLRADPAETRNLCAEEPDRCRELEEELEAWIHRRLQELGRAQDPLIAQGITLGRQAGG